MPIQFVCPHCGMRTQVGDRFAGQQGPCRKCGQTVTIPIAEDMSRDAQSPPAHRVACPNCRSHYHRPGPWPWYLGTIGALFVSARVCSACGHHFDARKPQADFAQRKLRLALLINGFGTLGIVTVIGLLGWFAYVVLS